VTTCYDKRSLNSILNVDSVVCPLCLRFSLELGVGNVSYFIFSDFELQFVSATVSHTTVVNYG
jgi:hypothetical protein